MWRMAYGICACVCAYMPNCQKLLLLRVRGDTLIELAAQRKRLLAKKHKKKNKNQIRINKPKQGDEKKTNTAAVVKFFHHQRTNKGRENAEDLSGREKCGALEASAIFPSCVISPVALCAKKYANKIVNGARHLPPAPFRPFQLLPLPHRMCLFVEDVSSLSQPKPLTSMSRRLKCLPIEIHRSAAFPALSFPICELRWQTGKYIF